MILVLIGLISLLVGIGMCIYVEKKRVHYCCIKGIGYILLILGISLSLGCGIISFTYHVCAAVEIKEAEIDRKSLINRYFITAPIELYDTERMSVSDVMKDIAKFNKKVEKYHYMQKNPWTSWLFSEKVSDALKTINVQTFGDGSNECPYQTAIVEVDKE